MKKLAERLEAARAKADKLERQAKLAALEAEDSERGAAFRRAKRAWSALRVSELDLEGEGAKALWTVMKALDAKMADLAGVQTVFFEPPDRAA